jgi:hypothetical protein
MRCRTNYVIGLTGSFGSGCNFLATEFIQIKRILSNANVKQTPFEGVTYNGYFKLFKEE